MPIGTTTACCCDCIVSKICLATVASVLPQCAFHPDTCFSVPDVFALVLWSRALRWSVSASCQIWTSRSRVIHVFDRKTGSHSQDSSRARTRLLHLPLEQKEGQVTASAWSATSFLTSTTWTTLSWATLCPRELTMESVGSAHVMVCARRGGLVRDGVLLVLVWVPPELKSTFA